MFRFLIILLAIALFPVVAYAQTESIDIWPMLEETLPTWAVGAIFVILAMARAVAKVIPDSQGGTLGTIRRIASFLSINIKNRE